MATTRNVRSGGDRPMPSTDETDKHAQVEAAAAIDNEGADFVRAFYRDVAPADVVARSASALSSAARSLRCFGAGREKGHPLVRVLPPTGESEGSVVEIVTDDMPFLVASVSSALAELGLE